MSHCVVVVVVVVVLMPLLLLLSLYSGKRFYISNEPEYILGSRTNASAQLTSTSTWMIPLSAPFLKHRIASKSWV